MEENITNFEIASSPEELQASMDREAQPQPEAPVQESAPETAQEEATELIEAQRGYELNAKVISAADEMLAATTQVR